MADDRTKHAIGSGRTARAKAPTARLWFEVTPDALYVANTGEPFDHAGVISVCRQYLSSKGASASDINLMNCADEALVREIRKRQIALYELDPNLLLEDRNAETETTRDYAGRCLLELLQNGDDAMAPAGATPTELIGAKGLGFKSVLEISDTPQIFSGPFHFGFDVVQSRRLLLHIPVGEHVSIFRLPHDVAPDAGARRLIKAGFSTVVKLPFRDENASAATIADLRALQPHFLLLAQHLEAVEIRFPSGARVLARTGSRGDENGATAAIRVRENKGDWNSSDWRVWRDVWPASGYLEKRLSVGIAVRLENGVPTPCSEPMPIHVFYPTEQQIGASFLIHAAFDVQQNRKQIRVGSNDEALLERLAAMTRRIALDIPSEATLALFRGLVAVAPKRKGKHLDRRIQYHMVEALRETSFISVLGRRQARVLPGEARTALEGFGALLDPGRPAVGRAAIARPELEDGFDVILELGGSRLGPAEYANLFRYARCGGVDACVVAAQVMLRTCLSATHVAPPVLTELHAAPIWPTADGRVRALAGDRPLLLKRPSNWPAWCEADELDPRFSQVVFPNGVISKEWERLTGELLHRTPEAFLRFCIAPALAAWDGERWEIDGWDALRLIDSWAGPDDWAKLKPYASDAKLGVLRDALVAVARIPVGKGWRQARHCYARPELSAPACFARYFKTVEDRHLCGFPSQARQSFPRDRWRALLRYLGASWEPKIWRFGDPQAGSDAGLPDQSAFWSAVGVNNIRHREKDWYLEHFPACLGPDTPPGSLMDIVESVLRVSESLEAEYLKVANAWKTHTPAPFHSFVQFQFRRTPFLPVKSNIWGVAHRVGSETYWPQRGIRGFTADLDLAGIKEARRVQLRSSAAKALGVKMQLPDRWHDWLQWNTALVAAGNAGRIPGGERTVRDFYEAMLEAKLQAPPIEAPPTLVCVATDGDGGLRAVPRDQASWIDRPALASPDILDALARAGLTYIPALLDRGAQASERFKIKRASSVVAITAEYVDASQRSAMLERRLQARWKAIAVQCEAKRGRMPAMPTIRAVNGLILSIHLGDQQVARISASSFLENGVWLIDLADPYEALAAALADGLGHAADMRYRFAALLKARNGLEVGRALMEDGIPPYRLASIQLGEDENDALGELDTPPEPGAGHDAINDNGEQGEGPTTAPPPPDPPAGPIDPPQPNPGGQGSPPDPARRPGASYYASGQLSARSLYDAGPGGGGGGGGGSGGSGWSERQREAGIEGESWLAGLIEATLPPGFSSKRNIRDALQGETDILIRSADGEWHVEVKTLATERIYWSELERGKAVRQHGRYWMCLLVPYGWTYRIHWSWTPLIDLLPCERRMQWQWACESQGPRLGTGSWDPIDGIRTPERQPDRATAVVRVQDVHLAPLDQDDLALVTMWGRVATFNTRSGPAP